MSAILLTEQVLDMQREIEEAGAVDTKIAFVALVFSAISILVSFISLHQNRKINITNLEAVYFEKIFTEYIVDKIPNSVEKIQFANNRLEPSYRELNTVMMEMIRDSKYYAYAKQGFYSELKSATMELEDKLIQMASEEVLDVERQYAFIYSVHQDVMGIIKLINKNYHSF